MNEEGLPEAELHPVPPVDDPQSDPLPTQRLELALGIAGVFLAISLIGYTVMGKGFAYLHLPLQTKIFVGEVLLGTLLFALAVSGRFLPAALRTPPGVLIAGLIGLGLMRTIPYLREFRVDALRDGVLYGYAVFALIVPELLKSRVELLRMARYMRPIALVYAFWVPMAYAIDLYFGRVVPLIPGTEVPIVSYKGGDLTVHLATALAWFLCVPAPVAPADPEGAWREDTRGVAWYGLVGAGAVASLTRSAYVAMAASIGCLTILVKFRQVRRVLLGFAIALPILVGLGSALRTTHRREISLEALRDLAASIVSTGDNAATGGGEGTKQWRLRWWRLIVEETVNGPYFWQGRGFGVNLAIAHGFEGRAEASLRSPHNSHLTILARMGVPGFLLWCLLHCALVWRFLSARRLALDSGDAFIGGVLGWVLCSMAAYVANATFDVFLEGPHGGICYWCLLGVGLAASMATPEVTRFEENIGPTKE